MEAKVPTPALALTKILPLNYAQLAAQSLNSYQAIFENLINQRKIPDSGLPKEAIKYILSQISAMDSNNFLESAAMGEREGRIFSSIVQERNFYLGHGIGRSGDLAELQPKAIGSSMLVMLSHSIVANALRTVFNLSWVQDVALFPLATGMALVMTFLTLKQMKPSAEYIIFSRIDQKTCLKSIITAGMKPIIVDMVEYQNCLITDVAKIKAILKELDPSKILCLFSISSCFSPRSYDNVTELAVLAKEHNQFHIINNAYGLQCTKIGAMITEAIQKGRVDAVVSSFDKNFMVPVGGSLVYGPLKDSLVKKVALNYPGRASMSPILDLFVTLLEMGKEKLAELVKERKTLFEYAKKQLQGLMAKYDEIVIENKDNKISLAISLGNLAKRCPEKQITAFGGYLYTRRVSGVKVVASGKKKAVCGIEFNNYGSHTASYSKLPYIAMAIAIGCKKAEIDLFLSRFEKGIQEFFAEEARKTTQETETKKEEKKG